MPNAPKRHYPTGVKPGYKGDHTIHPMGTYYVGDHKVRFIERAPKNRVVVEVTGHMKPKSPRRRKNQIGQRMTIRRSAMTREHRPKPARRGRRPSWTELLG
jgi:hypothetical protein